jgi:ligand-binding SRPBCC domain-containing protein
LKPQYEVNSLREDLLPNIKVETNIEAPPGLCFDLARHVNAHAFSTAHTRERIVDAPPTGLLQLGDEVEFEAVHFGIKQRLKSKIVEYDRPKRFVDEMQKGAFKRLRHTHEFQETPGGTLMIDTLDFASPFGALGAIADRLFLRRYMQRFLKRRSQALKRMAEKQS